MTIKEIIKTCLEEFKEKPLRDKAILVAPYILCMFFLARTAELYRLCHGDIFMFLKNIQYIYTVFPPHFHPRDLLIGISIGFFIVYVARWQNRMHTKKTKFGEEYGSARWGTEQDIKPFIDKDPFNNLILSQTEMLSMNAKMSSFKLNRNKHVIVTGSSGAGKTFRIVKPNLCQTYASYVLTDPKGTLLPETGNLFEKKGYNIYVLDTVNMESSMHYNPFVYIRESKDILTLANVLYANLKPPDAGTPPDPFFDQAALLWLQATIGYLWYEAPPEEQNIPTLLEILEADDVREDDESYENAVDMLFAELEKKNPRHFAVKQRKKYKKAAGKTAKSILISVGSYLSPFDIPEVAELVSYDELKFDTYGDAGQKSILYVIISDTDTTYNFIPAILFTQMFNVLCYKADKEMGGKLKVPVQFILDEFANIGKIPGFKTLIATIRSRLMGVIMILQAKSQLKDNYKDAAETIEGNCDSAVFLGGTEKSTLKDLEEALGKETIDLWNNSETFSQNRSTGVNYNKTGRELKTRAELNLMDRDKCIVQISGLPPFFSDKYDLMGHPNYKYLADYDERNTFDFAKYRRKMQEMENVTIRFHKNDKYKVIV